MKINYKGTLNEDYLPGAVSEAASGCGLDQDGGWGRAFVH